MIKDTTHTSNLRNIKPTRLKYLISHQGTMKHKFNISNYKTYNNISQNMIFESRVIESYCDKIHNTDTSNLPNLEQILSKSFSDQGSLRHILILPFYRIMNLSGLNTMYLIKGHRHISSKFPFIKVLTF